MFWVDRVVLDVLNRFAERIDSGSALVVRDEKTASGRVHVGSLRGVAVHGLVTQALQERGISIRYLYELNDMDPMDDIPSYLDEATYRPYLMRPLRAVPSPGEGALNFAEYYGGEFMRVIRATGFTPEFYRASELYERGDMDPYVRIALENVSMIRDIYEKVSGSKKKEDWFPVTINAQVARSTPTVVAYKDGSIHWRAEETNEEGLLEPVRGAVKLAWKVDWAAKWSACGVDIEGAGKDHSTRGGSRDVAAHIAREVFKREPPLDIPYEFFLVHGKKMSSSKGRGSSAKEIADLLPPVILRLALIGKEPMRTIDFIPDGDTIPVLFDEFDRLAAKAWSGVTDDDTRLFNLLYPADSTEERRPRFLPRFSLVAFLIQMPHLDISNEVAKLKGGELTEADIVEMNVRAEYARVWLDQVAPEAYRYTLARDHVPEAARHLEQEQKEALKALAHKLELHTMLDGQAIHTLLHDIKQTTGIKPELFFSALYLAFLGRASGPKAGWFLSTLDRAFVLQRLHEVSV